MSQMAHNIMGLDARKPVSFYVTNILIYSMF